MNFDELVELCAKERDAEVITLEQKRKLRNEYMKEWRKTPAGKRQLKRAHNARIKRRAELRRQKGIHKNGKQIKR